MSAIASMFSGIIFYLGLLKTKLTLKVFVIGIGASVVLALYAVALTQFNNIAKVVPGELFVLWGLLAPDNAFLCLTAIVTVKTFIAITGWVLSALNQLTNV